MGPNLDRQPDLSSNPNLTELGAISPDLDSDSRHVNLSPETVSGGENKPRTTTSTLQPEPVLTNNPIILSNLPPPTAPPLQNSNPLVADDSDLIEKEWVTKAKEIVMKTKHDPFLESKEINYFKADYLKKRYNKELKVPEV